MVATYLSRNFACRICDGDIKKAVGQDDNLCNEVEIVYILR